MNTNHYAMVREFHHAMGLPIEHGPTMLTPMRALERVAMMQEELNEFILAITTGDLASAADALVDLEYFVHGTAAQMGLPHNAIFEAVHLANMRKEAGPKPERGFAIDVRKPPGWKPADVDAILSAMKFGSVPLT